MDITGYAVYQGLATALDTLCAQAYGSGQKKLVGVHFQRMLCLLWSVTIPIGVLWIASPWVLSAIVSEEEIEQMAGLYLRVMFVGAPLAVALTNTLLQLSLLAYVRFVDGSQCWGGITRNPFTNWGPMVKLAIQGFVMVEAECKFHHLGERFLLFLCFWVRSMESSLLSTSKFTERTC